MTLKTKLLATTAAFIIATGGAVYADGHATHPETGEKLAAEQVFTYRDFDESPSLRLSSSAMF